MKYEVESIVKLHAVINAGPRSSRLKDKKKSEGETTIKDEFLRNIIENNRLLHVLGKGSSVVLIPQSSSDASACLNLRVGSYSRVNQRNIPLDEYSKIKPKLASLCERKSIPLLDANGELPKSGFRILDRDSQQDGVSEDDRFSQQRLFSCVTCGILAFDCAAIVQPREPAARHLMSADSNFFNEWTVNSGFLNESSHATDAVVWRKIRQQESGEESVADGLYNMPMQSSSHLLQRTQNCEVAANSEEMGGNSALGLLALAYGNSSDSDEDRADDLPGLDNDVSIETGSPKSTRHPGNPRVHIMKQEESSGPDDDVHLDYCEGSGLRGSNFMEGSHQILNGSPELENNHKRSCQSTVSITGCSEDTSRLHIFCLQHAVDVKERLGPIGGVHIALVCYQDYPRVEAEAKRLAEELGIDYCWNSITFRNATAEDEKMIQSSLDSEEAIPWNGDWSVKLGINLFYSANLCWSPLYSKQMPYNSVIYKAFGRDSFNSPEKSDDFCWRFGKQKKTVAGKWCGKVWMSHRVHPFLVQKDPEDQEEESSFHDKVEGAVSRGRTETSSAARKTIKKRKMAEEAEFIKEDIGDDREASEDLLVYSRQHHQRFGVLGPSKNIKRQNTNSDNQTDDVAHLSLKSALKQQSRLKEGISAISRSKFATDSLLGRDLPSDDVQEDDYLLQRIPKGKRAKLNRGEAAFLHKFEEKCYFRTNRRMVSTKQESVESEDAVSNGVDEDEAPPRQMNLRRERVRRNIHPYIEALQQIKGQKKLSKAKKLVVSGLTKVAAECSKNQEHSGGLDASDGEEVKGCLSRTLRKKTSKLAFECRGSKLVDGKSNQTEKKRKKNSKLPAMKRFEAKKEEDEGEHQCDLEGCTMSFFTSRELNLHKKNVCPVRGCGKKFFSHKYLVQHRRVHVDDRPLKCPWKGCKMTFKWPWARTEHVRVHTGERPYRCAEPGCGQTFRFVSDFSRHKRKTGHSVKG